MDRQNYDRMEVALTKAEESGCVIDLATPNTLQLDLDGETAYRLFLEQVNLMYDHSLLPNGTRVVARPSKSGNIHVTVVIAAIHRLANHQANHDASLVRQRSEARSSELVEMVSLCT